MSSVSNKQQITSSQSVLRSVSDDNPREQSFVQKRQNQAGKAVGQNNPQEKQKQKQQQKQQQQKQQIKNEHGHNLPIKIIDTVLVALKFFMLVVSFIMLISYIAKLFVFYSKKDEAKIDDFIQQLDMILYRSSLFLFLTVNIAAIIVFRRYYMVAVKHTRELISENKNYVLNTMRKNGHNLYADAIDKHINRASNKTTAMINLANANIPTNLTVTTKLSEPVKRFSNLVENAITQETQQFTMSLVWWTSIFTLPIYISLMRSSVYKLEKDAVV
jgi:hypothetical protein